MERAPSLISRLRRAGRLHTVNHRRSFHGRQFNDGHVSDPTGSLIRSKAHQTKKRPSARRGMAQFLAVAPGGKAHRKRLKLLKSNAQAVAAAYALLSRLGGEA